MTDDLVAQVAEAEKVVARVRVGELVERIEALEAALRQAKQYVHDSACDTDEADTVEHRDALMSRIDALAPRSVAGDLSRAENDVLAERHRQIDKEGWTIEHDDAHTSGEMALAAACYAQFAAEHQSEGSRWRQGAAMPELWPWSRKWWKPRNSRRDLVRAAALIIAEIERSDRKEKITV